MGKCKNYLMRDIEIKYFVDALVVASGDAQDEIITTLCTELMLIQDPSFFQAEYFEGEKDEHLGEWWEKRCFLDKQAVTVCLSNVVDFGWDSDECKVRNPDCDIDICVRGEPGSTTVPNICASKPIPFKHYKLKIQDLESLLNNIGIEFPNLTTNKADNIGGNGDNLENQIYNFSRNAIKQTFCNLNNKKWDNLFQRNEGLRSTFVMEIGNKHYYDIRRVIDWLITEGHGGYSPKNILREIQPKHADKKIKLGIETALQRYME